MSQEQAPRHVNRLIRETSPYLLQHAHNPVDWYPWGEEALRRAAQEDKPIFLSIGYSTCHWCHVMAHESFEDNETAELLNRYFVNIKVDREERPDLDEIYMSAVQIMTGTGGWPMTVFLTPELKPFYGGTYFPPSDMYGRPSFKTVIKAVADAWQERRAEVLNGAEQLAALVQKSVSKCTGPRTGVTEGVLVGGVNELKAAFDPTQGGFGGAPKFPNASALSLLLRHHAHTGDRKSLEMATFTLKKMAQGGLYDHLGGGFHRYSVDAQWLVPHFEKMLYDNAQLAQAYLEGYQATGDPFFKRVARETFEYILRDMTDASGRFYAAEDADSEGEEGTFYLWTQEEIFSILGENDGHIFSTFYNVRANGNFSSPEPCHEGKNILHTARPIESVAAELRLAPDAIEDRLNACRAALLSRRSARTRPPRDDKTLASWNALMISALAVGFQVLGEDRLRVAAQRAADFILSEMVSGGELLHSYRGGQARVPGYLDDYSFLVVALIDLYEATFELKWLTAADELARKMIENFWDADGGGFYFVGKGTQNPIARTKPTYDGAEPSGNSMAALGLLRLAKLTGNADYQARAVHILEINHDNLASAPRSVLKLLCAADFYVHPPMEIAVVGPRGSAGITSLLAALHRRFIPDKVVALNDPAIPEAALVEKRVPLLASKGLVEGRPAVYVCQDFVCKKPVTTPEALLEVLSIGKGG